MRKLLLLLVVLVGLGGTAISQTKIAHVESQILWDTLPSAKVALKQYAEVEKDAYDEMTAMQIEFEAAYKKYEVAQKDMIRTVREYEEKKLMEMQQKIETTNQSLKEHLMNVSSDLNAPLQDRIKRAIDIVAVRKKLAYVIDASSAIYYAGGDDITNEVIVELLKLDKAEAPTVTAPVTPN